MSSRISTRNPNSQDPSSSSSRKRKSRGKPETLNPNPRNDPKPSNSIGISPQNPPFAYSLNNLEQHTIVLLNGAIESYFALPPDYPMGPPQEEDYWSYLGLDEQPGPVAKRRNREGDEYAWIRESVRRYGNPNGEEESLEKVRALQRESVRRYGNPNAEEEEEDGLDSLGKARAWQREKVRRFGNPNEDETHAWHRESGRRYGNPNEERELEKAERDDAALDEAFLRCVKTINESLAERMMYLEDGKNGPLRCIVCGRTSKAFNNVHDLIMHTYTSQISELRMDHLGLHKALCVLMGWNYAMTPEKSKAYHLLSADEAAANREDLIVWPPTMIIHNTNTGRRKDGRVGGLSDNEVEMKLKELGFRGGISKSLYGKGGHLGIAAVKFASNLAGFKKAERLAEYFKKNNRGRERWVLVDPSRVDGDEKNPALLEVDKKTGEKMNIFYGYLATASDLEKVDVDTRKRAIIKSKRELGI